MNDQWVSEHDLKRRVDARKSLKGERNRIKCLHCEKKIPEDRNIRAKYCSNKCRDTHRWSVVQELMKKIRIFKRNQIAPKNCECGAPINQQVRQGPPAKQCKRCKCRKANAKYNAKRRGKSDESSVEVND